jgi:uncharacterized membrane protein
MSSFKWIFVFASLLLPSPSMFSTQASPQASPGVMPHRPGIHFARSAKAVATAAPPAGPANIPYNGGAVLPSTTTFAIWWGKLSDFPPDQVKGMDDFLSDLDGSDFLHIADQYMFGQKAHTRFGGNFFDDSAPTEMPFDSQFNDLLYQEVFKVLDAHGLKPDPTAIYFVYTSNYPAEAYAVGACADHSYAAAPDGTLIHFAYMPNLSHALVCESDYDPLFRPNFHSEGTRAMASTTAHEFMETITDPNYDGWYSPSGGTALGEIGDFCVYIYKTWVPLKDDKWKIQMIWSNEANGCVQGADHEVKVSGALYNSGIAKTFDIPSDLYGTFAQSINGNGAIAGNYLDAFNAIHAFVRRSDNSLIPFDFPGATTLTFAQGINDSGTIGGLYLDANGVNHGFLRDENGIFTTFDAPGADNTPFAYQGTYVNGINEAGAVAGYLVDVNSVYHSFIRDSHGIFATFDTPGAGTGMLTGTTANGINSGGAVTGNSLDANFVNHGFVRDENANITTFDVPGAAYGTFANAINNDGEITGFYTDSEFVSHSFIRGKNGLITTFDSPGAVFGTYAYGINEGGSVAGYYSDKNGYPRGFVRDRHGNFKTIDVPDKSYGTVLRSINDEGQTAGYHTVPTP